MTTPLFTDPFQQLLQDYWPDQPKTTKRRPPWTWSILSAPERLALTARIGDWVERLQPVLRRRRGPAHPTLLAQTPLARPRTRSHDLALVLRTPRPHRHRRTRRRVLPPLPPRSSAAKAIIRPPGAATLNGPFTLAFREEQR